MAYRPCSSSGSGSGVGSHIASSVHGFVCSQARAPDKSADLQADWWVGDPAVAITVGIGDGVAIDVSVEG
ncbi:hypothetical protein TUM20983_34780 [Mycobacterium antarcticum]|nr:hypothetical protein TUM20983_34780 [Mycolicibacterium sp. TUM20983]